jgi:glycosyltransferase involved in cell wall biosynthesis
MKPRSEIEVYVLTRNRRELLRETLRSLLAQTLPPRRLVVLDNCSDDGTAEAVREEFGGSVEVDRSGVFLGVWQNSARAAAACKSPWVMVAHDDDLYHPEYLQEVSKVLMRTPSVGIVVAGMSYEVKPHPGRWRPMTGHGTYCPTPESLAFVLYNGFGANFGSAIYRTDVLRRTEVEAETYANYADRPLLLAVAREGGAFVLQERYVQYRIHRQQDSHVIGRSISPKYLLRLQDLYRRLLRGKGLRPTACFRFRQIYNLYIICRNQGGEGDTVWRHLRDAGETGPAALLLGGCGWLWFSMRSRLVELKMAAKVRLQAR